MYTTRFRVGALLVIALFVVVLYYFRMHPQVTTGVSQQTNQEVTPSTDEKPVTPSATIPEPAVFINPIDTAASRITKKHFGTKVSPGNSPVSPERFGGYHTGVDFEIKDGEASKDIPIRATCEGKIVRKQWVSGYGGLVVQECILDGKTISILYGHLNIASVTEKVGQTLKQGDAIGNLGAAYSTQTDGERKHLHLAFYNGSPASIRGYVSTQAALKDWIDPCLYICK